MKRLRLRIARAFAEVTSLVILVTACGAQDSAAIPLRVAGTADPRLVAVVRSSGGGFLRRRRT